MMRKNSWNPHLAVGVPSWRALGTGFLTMLVTTLTPAHAQGECVTSKDVRFCSSDSATTVSLSQEQVAIRSTGDQGQTRIELPATAESMNLAMTPPAPLATFDDGVVWALSATDDGGRTLVQLDVSRQSGSTVISAAAPTAANELWRLDSYYQGQLVATEEMIAPMLHGSGEFFGDVSVDRDGRVSFSWTESAFQRSDGLLVDHVEWKGSGELGPLGGGILHTTMHPISLEDWLIKNRSVIGCNPTNWVEHLGSIYADGARDVAAYDPGSIARGEAYVTGSFRGNVNNFARFGSAADNRIDFIPSRDDTEDMFIAKLDDCGRWLWVRTGGSPTGDDVGHAVAVDKQRNVVVVGSMSGSGNAAFTIDPGPGIPLVSASGFGDPTIFVAKYNHQGTLQWFKTFGSGTATDVDTDSQNDIFVTFSKPNGSFLFHIDGSNGNMAGPPIPVGSPLTGLELTGVTVGDQDRLCIAGNFTKKVTVAGQDLELTHYHRSAFVAIFDNTKILEMLKPISTGTGDVTASAVASAWQPAAAWPNSSPSWDCLVAGDFQGELVLADSSMEPPFPGDKDAFVARYDVWGGQPESVIHIGGFGNQHAEDIGIADHGKGHLWITGFFDAEIMASANETNFNDTFAPDVLTITSPGRDAFLLRYDEHQSFDWLSKISGAGNDQGMGVAVLPKNQQIYAVGSFDDEADFFLPSMTTYTINSNRGLQGYVTGLFKP